MFKSWALSLLQRVKVPNWGVSTLTGVSKVKVVSKFSLRFTGVTLPAGLYPGFKGLIVMLRTILIWIL